MVMTEKLDPALFDESFDDGDDLYGFELQDGLTEEQIEDAKSLIPFIRGVMIVTGMPGSGKDLWLNALSYKIKRYFKNRKVFKDEKPKRLFGYYEPFNTMTVAEELSRIGEELMPDKISRRAAKTYQHIASLAEQWLTMGGEEKLTGGILCMTEFWKYMHNRNPFNPMGILLGAVIKRWRHLDLLLIGNAPKKRELDRYSCLPYITHEVRCSWLGNNRGKYRIFRTRYVGTEGVLEVTGKPKVMVIDGNAQRELLGGQRYYDLFVSKSKASF